jgi:hypothetical protein
VPLVERPAPERIAIGIASSKEVDQRTPRSPDPMRAKGAKSTKGAKAGGGRAVDSLSPQGRPRQRSPGFYFRGHNRRVRDRALDFVIAATALGYDLQLVTRNLADYADISGLTVFDQR